MKKLLFIALLGVLPFIISCGGGSSSGGDSSSAPIANVSGTYALTTGTMNGKCSNGNTLTVPAFSQNVNITQSGNIIKITGSSSPLPAGAAIVSRTYPNGTVDSGNHFVMNGSTIMTLSGISGQVSGTDNYSGTFTTTGWSGALNFTYLFQSYNTSCNVTGNFSGSKQ